MRRSATAKSVAATTNWSLVNTSFGGLSGGGGGGVELSPTNLATVTSQLRSDFSSGPLTLDPPSADWAALTSEPYSIAALPVLKKIPAKLEVAYRYPLAGHLRYVERTSRKLARATFYGMARWQGKLERKQGFLGRIVDIGAELYAMSAACTRALLAGWVTA